jgi:hypothetical protein
MQNKQLIPDKVNCTYWWIINLDTKNPANRTDVMHGYSKFQKQAEAKDKNDILFAKLEMFYKNGYFKRIQSIDIYKRVAPFPSKQGDQLLITLFPDDYTIPISSIGDLDQEVQKYLQKFYGHMLRNMPVDGLRPLKDPTKNSKDNLFDIRNYTFKNFMDLDKFCQKLIANEHPKAQVFQFMRSYAQKYF